MVIINATYLSILGARIGKQGKISEGRLNCYKTNLKHDLKTEWPSIQDQFFYPMITTFFCI